MSDEDGKDGNIFGLSPKTFGLLGAGLGGILGASGSKGQTSGTQGYAGGIPDYTATRSLVPNAFDPTGRRPGEAGRRYFTDVDFTRGADNAILGGAELDALNAANLAQQKLYDDAGAELLGIASLNQQEQAAVPAGVGTGIAATPAATPAAIAPTATSAAQTQSVFDAVDPSDGFSDDEAASIANLILGGQTGIENVSKQYEGVSEMDVIEGMLRGGYESPAAMTERLAATTPDLTEVQLMASLLSQGRTTPEELAAYYSNNPDYPEYAGVTADQVRAYAKERGIEGYAAGGDINGYYLGGTTDGMADNVPATIDNMQPAALSDGEFVIPADVVSHLGNGNSDSGAQNLYSMMERVRTDRTGNPNQGNQIDPNQYLA